jgi:hypothetical protein
MNQQVKDMASGMIAGSLTCAALHPFDSLKTRFQSEGRGERTRTSIFQSKTLGIIKRDGFMSLYHGITPAMIGVGGSWGLYFLL